MPRYAASNAALDEAEQRWWQEHGDLEEDYCWVQTRREQRILRNGYVRRIAAAVPPGARVLELGCGAGWLTIELAQRCAASFVGVDFSPSQIERAQRASRAAGTTATVRFEVAGGPAADVATDGAFDVVVMHAFLHHLAVDEIRTALARAASSLRVGGRLFLVEPVHFADGRDHGPVALQLLRRLAQAPIATHHRGLRPLGEQESTARGRMDRRASVAAPFGPSPKEIPFAPGELDGLLAEHFDVDEVTPVMSMSHLVAQELLLAGRSQPRLWGALSVVALPVAARLDAWLLASRPLPSSVWVFELYSARARP